MRHVSRFTAILAAFVFILLGITANSFAGSWAGSGAGIASEAATQSDPFEKLSELRNRVAVRLAKIKEVIQRAIPPDITLESLPGRTIGISPDDLPGEIYFYEITGLYSQRFGDSLSIELYPSCGAKFRGHEVRALVFYAGLNGVGWHVEYLEEEEERRIIDATWRTVINRDQQPVHIWFPPDHLP